MTDTPAPTPSATTCASCAHGKEQHESACWQCRREGKFCGCFTPVPPASAPAATAGTTWIDEQLECERAIRAEIPDKLVRSITGRPAAPTGEEAEWLQRFMAQGLRDAENYHDVDGSLTGHPDAWRRAVQAVTAQATELAALRKAREAWHYYVCASDQELRDAGLTRADALRVAYEADDAARAALAPRQT